MPSESGDKENNIKSTIGVVGGKLLDLVVDSFSSKKGERLKSAFILPFATALVLTLLILPSQQLLSIRHKTGEIASGDVKATQDYLVEDLALTEKKRAEAEAAAPYIYNLDPRAAESLKARFEKALDRISRSRNADDGDDKGNIREELSQIFGFELSAPEFGALSRIRGSRAVISEIGDAAGRVYSRKVVADKRLFESDMLHGVLIVNTETGQESGVAAYSSYMDASEAQNLLRRIHLNGVTVGDQNIINGLLTKAIQPNVIFNRDATELKMRKARAAVSPVLFQVKRGEMIVREGERISEQQALKLKRISEAPQGLNRLARGVGVFTLILIFFYFTHRFARKNIRKFNISNKDLLFLSLVTCCFFIVLKISFLVSLGLPGLLPFIEPEDYFYIFPFAIGSMLVRIVLNSEVALVYSLICAPMIGMMFSNSLPVAIYALLGAVVGAHGVRQCKDRGTIYTAGLKVGVLNISLAVAFQIMGDNLFSFQTVYCAIFAGIGGILNSVFVTGLIPLAETIFHYTTDIKLLELSNLNSPMLRELMIRAPGTYHHSVVVGNLVEAAAETINANPLLARVAAYYHDIGKLSKPLYFIENVSGCDNKHDKLSPNMSALILISHVKEGVEMAREQRLGRHIIDIIRQSHGTSQITFFYQKAKNMEEPEVQTVDERDFRYPGPKPQTREAGLVMLADCVEAASRTLTDPTPARIQGMVQKIINNIFTAGELDECELTLKNLHEIAKSFNRILSGIFHHRIDYPEPVFKGNVGRKTTDDSHREQAKAPADSDEESKKGGAEDIKRLGITR